MLASDIEGRLIYGADGDDIGTLEKLLYHPSEPVVVGALVRRPHKLGVVKGSESYVALADLSFRKGGPVVDVKKLPTARQAYHALGHDPDLTVIWTGMPVVSPTDETVGVVRDVEFDRGTGAVTRVEVAAGMIADAAHGRFVVPGDALIGYSAGAVRITREAGQLEASGGFAHTAARVAAVTEQRAAEVGKAVEDTVVAASAAAGRTIKKVSDAKIGEKTVARARGTWRDTIDAFKEGMKDD